MFNLGILKITYLNLPKEWLRLENGKDVSKPAAACKGN